MSISDGDASPPLFESKARVLFQGDSITDMGRGRTEDPNHLLGHGYVFLISAAEAANFPERNVTVLNRGVSGNTSSDLSARWPAEAFDLRPDVLSLLIGVNDVNHKLREGQPFSVEEYRQTCDRLLAGMVVAFPGMKLILGEPFFGLGSLTAARIDEWHEAMATVRETVAELAEKYRAPVVPYQRMFDAAAQRAPITEWIWDGIHPTYAGHYLMAQEWKRHFRAFHGPPSDAA